MTRSVRAIILMAIVFAVVGLIDRVEGQQPNRPNVGITVQLPTVSTFGISTVVMVPDGGMARLGGVSRGASGISSSGLPFLSNVPGVSPLFRSQGFGSEYSSSMASVQAHIIIHEEIEEQIMAEAERRIAARQAVNPNGNEQVQRRAAFISRNVGRK